MIKYFFGSKAGKIWTIVSSCVLVFALVITILASTVFFDLICGFIGRKIPVYADGVASMFPATESTSKSEAFENANKKT